MYLFNYKFKYLIIYQVTKISSYINQLRLNYTDIKRMKSKKNVTQNCEMPYINVYENTSRARKLHVVLVSFLSNCVLLTVNLVFIDKTRI